MATIDQDDLVAFIEAVRRLLADRSSEAAVRRTMESSDGYDRELWRELASMGVTGLLVDSRHGGTGAGPVEIERVMEEMGAVLACTPLLSSGVLAAGLLQALDDADAQARLLPGIANGSRIATVALTGPGGGWTADDLAVTARPAGEGWQLDGTACYVTHGQVADLFLVVARTLDGVGVFELPAGTQGAQLSPLPVFDRTQPLANLSLAGAAARRLACNRPGWEAVDDALDLARVALAGEQAGAARHVLEATVAFAQERYQFGRAIGSFQAVKHHLARAHVAIELAWPCVWRAAHAVAGAGADRAIAVSLAKARASAAALGAARAALQCHGAIGYSFEHDLHLWMKRAWTLAAAWGDAAWHTERVAALILDPTSQGPAHA